jgi:hypothetical protein
MEAQLLITVEREATRGVAPPCTYETVPYHATMEPSPKASDGS